jgi:hypothetical protein
MTLGRKKQSSRLSAPESKIPWPFVVQKASFGLAKDRHRRRKWRLADFALRQPVEVAASIHHPSPHGRVRTSNTPSFPLKGCKKIVMIVTIVTR